MLLFCNNGTDIIMNCKMSCIFVLVMKHIFTNKPTIHLYIERGIVLCLCICPELIGKTISARILKICMQG